MLGLGRDSRLQMKIANTKLTLSESVECLIFDALKVLIWFKTKDGENNINRPASLFKELSEVETKEQGFDTPEEYEAEKQRILEGINNG